jgi:hypothetical protein
MRAPISAASATASVARKALQALSALTMGSTSRWMTAQKCAS